MTIRDLYHNVNVASSLVPAVRTASATGSAVDLRGYDSAIVTVTFGAYGDGTHTPKLQHSVDGVTYADVLSSDVVGELTALSDSTGANASQTIGYIGQRRYVRVVMTVASASTGVAYVSPKH